MSQKKYEKSPEVCLCNATWQLDLKVTTENPACASVPSLIGHSVWRRNSCTVWGFGSVLSPSVLQTCKIHSFWGAIENTNSTRNFLDLLLAIENGSMLSRGQWFKMAFLFHLFLYFPLCPVFVLSIFYLSGRH